MKKGKGRNNGGGGLLPSSLRIISSCLKTVSTNASTVASTVRSAGASVAASISASEDHKDQVTWAGFDRLELGHSVFKRVLLLGYQNGFQVFDVEDASNYSELVSKRDGPVSFLQMQPFPAASDGKEGFSGSHPLLLVVAGDDTNSSGIAQNHSQLGGVGRDGGAESRPGNPVSTPTTVRFYSLRSHSYVHVLRFRSAVCMVRCSPRIVAVGLAAQIYCFDALTLENKFSVLTYPVPQLAGQGSAGFNIGYGPMAVGPRWLAYASNSPLMSNSSRLGPQNPTSSGVSPSTSPGSGSYVARYAMESSKHLAAGIINLGDMGCKSLYKYCQELLPDGSSSPVSSNSGWKVGRLAGTEMNNAGMVVVKDFASRAVISHFKAHTSPISALCFDPSGTLLVTASIYGNNINIFRIMPSCKRSGSGVQDVDWTLSHVHLYKLHRGITSAMIQDICFSSYSQWIAIVSSKGTCHVYVLSPFGGDAGFQVCNTQGEEPSLCPVLSLPWWSTTSCTINQQSFPPPPAVALSVVSRIKYSSFGWLSTVNNTAGSATGKVFVPSGAVAAVFHNSLSQSVHHSNSKDGTLEHLLVYTPSGHVVQHELQPRVGGEESHSGLSTQTGTYMHVQEEDLRVKVEPIQWWDVCRRSDWPEREECILGSTSNGQDGVETIPSKSGSDGSHAMEFLHLNGSVVGKRNVEIHRSWNLSNAEVQISSLTLPIWQKSKIGFYTMECQRVNSSTDGEFEVEKVPVHEIEMRQKELLPVFDQFRGIKSSWNDRVLVGKCSSQTSSESHQSEGKFSEETVICHSNPASLSSTESSDGGSSRRTEHLFDFDQMNNDLPRTPMFQTLNGLERRANVIVDSSFQNQTSFSSLFAPFEHLKNISSQVVLPVLESKLAPTGRFCAEEGLSVKTIGMSEYSAFFSDQHASSTVIVAQGDTNLQHPIDLSQFFQEGHCKALEQNGCLSEIITDDVDSDGSQCDKVKPLDEKENSDMLGELEACLPFLMEVDQ